MEKILQFAEELKIPYQFVCMFDNSTPALVERCEKKMKEMLGDNGFSVITNCLEDLDHLKICGHPERMYNDGSTTVRYLHGSWTFYVTSMEQIKERADNGTVIYFSECDYLYKDDSLIKGFKMIDAHDGDFVTLYEHPEIYVVNTDPKWAAGTKEFSGHKWRPCSSTCLTFLATLKSINKYPEMFLESKNDWGDCGLWENIGRTGGSTLWMSVPTLAFHCFSHNMPYTDWKDLYNSMVDKGKF